MEYAFHETVEAGHGRLETRRIWMTEWIEWYAGRQEWAGLRTFIGVESVRESGGQTSTERRYCISDLPGRDARGLLGYIRGHWGIENKLHGSLDMTFREDESRLRKGHSAENISRMRRLALNLLRKEKNCKAGAKGKRLQAALNDDYLLQVLCQGI